MKILLHSASPSVRSGLISCLAELQCVQYETQIKFLQYVQYETLIKFLQ